MKKFLAIMMCLALVFAMAACGEKKQEEQKTETPAEPETFTVGVCQLVQHEALDAATNGFTDALKAALGDKVEIINQNASGDPATCTTIVNGYISQKVDLIMANATPALQAAVAATTEIPILGTSITEYGTALDIDDFSGTVGGNVSGTSDLAPLDEQALMVDEWFPDAKTVGLLYCSSEANSVYQVTVVDAALQAIGFETKIYTFTDSNDVASVTQKACGECDVLYIPTDNTAASNTEAIANVALPEKTPIICGEESLCKGCGVATLSIDYYDLGTKTGEMAAEILQGGDISTMPIAYAPQFTKKFNKEMCDALGLTVPEGYVQIQ